MMTEARIPAAAKDSRISRAWSELEALFEASICNSLTVLRAGRSPRETLQ